jgi:hypothetical protein
MSIKMNDLNCKFCLNLKYQVQIRSDWFVYYFEVIVFKSNESLVGYLTFSLVIYGKCLIFFQT